MPFILRFPKRRCVNRAGKGALARTVVERNANLMRAVVVLVDDHQRPITMRTLYRIGCDKHVSFAVFYVTGGPEEFVLCRAGLDPILRNYLGSEELRGFGPYHVVRINHEHVIGPPAVRAVGVRW